MLHSGQTMYKYRVALLSPSHSTVSNSLPVARKNRPNRTPSNRTILSRLPVLCGSISQSRTRLPWHRPLHSKITWSWVKSPPHLGHTAHSSVCQCRTISLSISKCPVIKSTVLKKPNLLPVSASCVVHTSPTSGRSSKGPNPSLIRPTACSMRLWGPCEYPNT